MRAARATFAFNPDSAVENGRGVNLEERRHQSVSFKVFFGAWLAAFTKEFFG
jgi:hypothetical protein